MTTRITSGDIPQADTLHSVVGAIEAVGAGKWTNAEIAEHNVMTSSREGLYYFEAARILGFVLETPPGRKLTTSGKRLLAASASGRMMLLREAVMAAPIVTRVLEPFMGRTDDILNEEFIRRMALVFDLTGKTVGHRTHTITRWLEQIEVLVVVEGRTVFRLVTKVTPEKPLVEMKT
jgi:hypothetical protein